MEETSANLHETLGNRHFAKNASPRPPHGGGFKRSNLLIWLEFFDGHWVCHGPCEAPTRAGAGIFGKPRGLGEVA